MQRVLLVVGREGSIGCCGEEMRAAIHLGCEMA